MRLISIATIVLRCAMSLLALPSFAQSVETPAGWTIAKDGAKSVYKPGGLSAGESFTLTIGPPFALGEREVVKWFTDRVREDAAKRGTFKETEPVTQTTLGIVSTERVYGSGKVPWDVVYVSFPLSDHRALFCLMVSNLSPDSPSYHQDVRQAGKLCGQTAKSLDKSNPVPK